MKKLFFAALLCLCALNLRAQGDITLPAARKGNQFYAGYSRNLGEKEEKLNIVEIGLGRVDFGGFEPSGTNYYAGNEFVFNSHHFSIGPKIGASASLWLFGLGGEFIYYTDFHGNTLHFAPYISLGSGMTKLNFRYHIPLYNKDYAGINQVSIGVTIALNKPKQK